MYLSVTAFIHQVDSPVKQPASRKNGKNRCDEDVLMYSIIDYMSILNPRDDLKAQPLHFI